MTNFQINITSFFLLLSCLSATHSGAQVVRKHGAKYDTLIVKHSRPAALKPPTKVEAVLPVPEYINQPYFFDRESNKLIALESAGAVMETKKKTFGLQGAKQSLLIDAAASSIRFTAKKDIAFIIRTSGDVIDLTSYIRLYRFIPVDQRRQVTINSKDGVLSDKEEAKGKLVSFNVKMLTRDSYLIQLPEQSEAGEYGFVWVKNMEQRAFTVFAYGVDWKNAN